MILTLENLHMFVDEVGDCLLWKLGVNSAKRPIARLGGRPQLVGRYIYQLMHGPIPKKRLISPACGNLRCLSCLEAVTRSQMMIREHAEHSKATPRHAKLIQTQLERGYIKLDMQKANEIRLSEDHPKVLATRYGVSESAIRDVKARRRWKEPTMSVFNL